MSWFWDAIWARLGWELAPLLTIALIVLGVFVGICIYAGAITLIGKARNVLKPR